MDIKTKIQLRPKCDSILDNVVRLSAHLYPELRYIQNLWATNIIDREDRFSEEPYDTIVRILPRIADLINVEFKEDLHNKICRMNILNGLERLGLAKKTEDLKLELIFNK